MTSNRQPSIASLLYEEESDSLDFKRDQYRFDNATKPEKAELLKDILAFANAWRRTDAYILIGIEEIKGTKNKVVGVSKHIEDASLQQFVNSKTQRPVYFSYQARLCEDKKVGIIHIPVQERPIYLKKDFGGLSKNVVYVRRGTSTVKAEPEEIAKMSKSDSDMQKPSPSLDFFFFDKETGECSNNELSIRLEIINIPEKSKLPDYESSLDYRYSVDNKDYYRELANYHSSASRVTPLYFAIKNSGKAIASNVRLEIQVDDVSGDYLFIEQPPEKPSEDTMSIGTTLQDAIFNKSEVTIKRYTKSWYIQVNFGNIQPGQMANNECPLYFGASKCCVFTFNGVVFSDETQEPIQFPMSINVEVDEKYLTNENYFKAIQGY